MRSYRSNKTDQIRVRITHEERDALEREASRIGGSTTLSDVIREALGYYLNPDPKQRPCTVTSAAMKTVERLAGELKRTPEQILDECVRGIADQLDSKTEPLIVQEWRLRQEYRQGLKQSK